MFINRLHILILFVSILSFSGCEKINSDTDFTYQISKVKSSFIANNKFVFGKHSKTCQMLLNSTSNFNSSPNITFFNLSKNNWTVNYGYFNQLKPVYYMNFSHSPFPNDLNSIDLSKMNIEYVDYSLSNSSAGIISDITNYPSINYQNIINWHQINSPENLTLGYHVLEFLLWGEDISVSGPGSRSNGDYITGNTIRNRRRTFLLTTIQNIYSQLVIDHSWGSAIENEILAMDGKEFIQKSINGMIQFIEEDFAEKTILLPYNTQDITDESSPFSDNTINDLKNKNLAIKHFLYGNDSILVQGNYFLNDLFKEIDETKAKNLREEIDQCNGLIYSIQGNFDSSLTNGEREKLKSIYDALYRVSGILKEYLLDLE